jgi:hypothetical protein
VKIKNKNKECGNIPDSLPESLVDGCTMIDPTNCVDIRREVEEACCLISERVSVCWLLLTTLLNATTQDFREILSMLDDWHLML